ncbi:RNA-binding protein [candidate division Kazan bacterium]|uniref:RNA-binding protein KhpA n=1 Tax=candidate division Kazan bacterium TaxID=2202143 RepID=A0A420ZCW1_UNCK3|nr:MAG: RNA-binding protein [candidate division Kazan bacterium]
MAEKDQEFVEYVVKAVVEQPDKVKVERKIDELGVLIELTVDPEDMGKIIGKDGRTAKAIRTLLRVIGAQNNARVNLKIIEPEGGTGGVKSEAAPAAEAEKAEEAKEEAPAAADLPETTTKDDLKDIDQE